MKLSKRRIDTAPKSDRQYRKTSRPPVAIAGRSWGRVTLRNVAPALLPSDRDTSSNEGSMRSSDAATGRNT